MSVSDIINVRKDLEVVSLRQLAPEDGSSALGGKGIEGLYLPESGVTTESDIYLDYSTTATSGVDYQLAQAIAGLGWSSCAPTSPTMTGTGIIDVTKDGELVCIGGTISTSATAPTQKGLLVTQNSDEIADILFDLDVDKYDDDYNLKDVLLPAPTSSITGTKSGASYGFTYNSSTGYWVSGNAGVSNSAAVCTLNFTVSRPSTVTIKFINYAESGWDYGLFSKIDTALGTTYSSDASANCQLICSDSTYNISTEQTLTYTNIAAGTHFIDIKFRKDSSVNKNNDNLQFKYEITPKYGVGWWDEVNI